MTRKVILSFLLVSGLTNASELTKEDLISRLTAPAPLPTTIASDFTGGALSETVVQAQAQHAAALAPKPMYTLEQKWDAFRRNTITNSITNLVTQRWMKDEFYDYDEVINHAEVARRLIAANSLAPSDENFKALTRAGTAKDMAKVITRLREQQIDLNVLQQHPSIAFASRLFDPITLLMAILLLRIIRRYMGLVSGK